MERMRAATGGDRGRGGQMALVDALVFLVLMGIASGLVLAAAGSGRTDMLARQAMQQYTENLADTLMNLEIELPAGDLHSNGTRERNSTWTSLPAALLDMALTGSQDNASAGREAAVMEAARGVARPDIGLALECRPDNSAGVFISDTAVVPGEMPDERYASAFSLMLYPEQSANEGSGVMVTVTVYTWVMG